MIRAGIIGATGYAGAEIVRLLQNHPDAEIEWYGSKSYIEQPYADIYGSMLPKLQNCISALKNGVSRVHILDGRIAHCLLLEFFTHKGIGTAIVSDETEGMA